VRRGAAWYISTRRTVMSGASWRPAGSSRAALQVVIESLDAFGGNRHSVFVRRRRPARWDGGNQLPQLLSESVSQRDERALPGRSEQLARKAGLLTRGRSTRRQPYHAICAIRRECAGGGAPRSFLRHEKPRTMRSPEQSAACPGVRERFIDCLAYKSGGHVSVYCLFSYHATAWGRSWHRGWPPPAPR